MLKKTIMVGGALLLLMGLFFGRDACSYLATTVGKVHQTVKNSVPVEFEISRARDMIESLKPEIEKNMHTIAKEEVAVAKLERQVRRAEEQLAKDRGDIFRLKSDLDTGTDNFVYAGRTYNASQVKADLANRFEYFKTSEATLDKLEQVLRARQSGLESAREKLEQMLAAKRQLEVDVENLEARMKMIEVAQTASEISFDDSRLSRTRELIDEINTRLDVADRLLNTNTQLFDRIPLDDPEAESNDILEEITRHFENRPEVQVLVGSVETQTH